MTAELRPECPTCGLLATTILKIKRCGLKRERTPDEACLFPIAVDIAPGQRWRFEHYGLEFTVDVTELVLEGDVVHGRVVKSAVGSPGDMMIVPTSVVILGERVTPD